MYSVKQLAVSKTPNCILYPEYKKVFDQTSFLPENTPFKIRYWYYTNNIKSPVVCGCGCGILLKLPHISKYAKGHSNSAPEVKEKKKKSLQEKYGSEITNVSQLKEIKQKKKETTFKNHGVETPFDRKFITKFWQEKLGVSNPSELPSVKEKLSQIHKVVQKEKREQKIQTRRKNFYQQKLVNHSYFKPLFSEDEYIGCRNVYLFECKKCGEIIEDKITDGTNFRCYTCNPRIDSGGQSLIEKELEDFCKQFNLNIATQSRKIIPPLEIDLYFPEKKIAIELNGLFYHSEKMNKKRHYHFMKTKLCAEQDIQLIQIFEDEWNDKKQICKSRIKHLLGLTSYKIYARKCTVKSIDKNIKDKFLRKYHIQGNDKSLIHKGLFYKNRLVSVMTFGPLRKATGNTPQENHWELIRFCSIKNFFIIGGAQKLFQSFLKENNPDQVLSYADLRWSGGSVYEKLGFTKVGNTQPNYWYVISNQRKHRFQFQKHLLKEKLKTFDPNLSEYENMMNNGYTRIWDCGHGKYVFKS